MRSSPSTSVGDLRVHPLGSHAGVFLLRLDDQRPDAVVSVLRRLMQSHDLDDLAGCLVVITERLVRIRWPS